MKRSDVERKLNEAVRHTTPDIRDAVLNNCKNPGVQGQPIVIKNIRRKRERIYGFIAMVAMLLLVCNVVLSVSSNTRVNTAVTTIDIDVNPSIELKVNQDDKIVSVRAINDDAVAILDGMELNGTRTNVAVNAIVGSMVKHGYLQGNTNSILVSVNNSDQQVSRQIQSVITEDIDELMRAYSREVSVIGQTIVKDPELKSLSDSYSISEGKAALIRKIIEYNNIYTMDELAVLTISELNEIICSMEDMSQLADTVVVEPLSDMQVASLDVVEEPAMSDDQIVATEEDLVSDNSVSDNFAEDSISENAITNEGEDIETVSDNEASDSVSDNSVSDNEIADTENDENADNDDGEDEETISENGIIGDAVIIDTKEEN